MIIIYVCPAVARSQADVGAAQLCPSRPNRAPVLILSQKDAPERAKELESKYGVKAHAWQCDVGDEDKVIQTFKEIGDHPEFGNITGVVANAGVSVVKPALELTKEARRPVR